MLAFAFGWGRGEGECHVYKGSAQVGKTNVSLSFIRHVLAPKCVGLWLELTLKGGLLLLLLLEKDSNDLPRTLVRDRSCIMMLHALIVIFFMKK